MGRPRVVVLWTLAVLLSPVTAGASSGIGLSAARPLDLDDPDNIFSTKKQKKMCERMPGMKRVLLEAVRLSVASCAELMADQRWNCTLGPGRLRLLSEAFKETAFLYAITSAAIAHTTARACAAGQLTACTCDLAPPAAHEPVAERWRWGGCGHNVRFASRFSRRLLRRRSSTEEDRSRRLVHRHNWKVGIKMLTGRMTTRCKCHGVSGSCQLQTCWKQVGTFAHTGTAIKRKYETALVFSDSSPSFCERDAYGPGTAGRQCQLGGHCAVLCCGRGYNTQMRSLVSSCNCHVLWQQRTFKVDCQRCTNVTEVYTCK